MPLVKRLTSVFHAALNSPRRVSDSIRWRILDKLLIDPVIAPYLSFFAWIVLRARSPLIIGVTGSVGKTTTVDMITAVLGRQEARSLVGRVASASKNMNDDVGVPLAILLFERWLPGNSYSKLVKLCLLPLRACFLACNRHYPDVLVLEYGTHWQGHLHRLAKLAPPNIAVVTTIGVAHLERLKTLEGVVHEKGAIVRAVSPDGLVVLGDDHSYVSHLEQISPAPVVKARGRGFELSRNIARAIGLHFGISDAVIRSALADFAPPNGRLNRIELEHLTVIDDSFNANPLSMRLGLDVLSETANRGARQIAILGFMAELGDDSPKYHMEVGRDARMRADLIIGVGELARHYNPDFWFPGSDACAKELATLLRPGDCVLVKGSASAKMVRIVSALREARVT